MRVGIRLGLLRVVVQVWVVMAFRCVGPGIREDAAVVRLDEDPFSPHFNQAVCVVTQPRDGWRELKFLAFHGGVIRLIRVRLVRPESRPLVSSDGWLAVYLLVVVLVDDGGAFLFLLLLLLLSDLLWYWLDVFASCASELLIAVVGVATQHEEAE